MDLIRILREMGKYTEAIGQLKILIQQKPNEHRYRLALLETTFRRGSFGNAAAVE